MIAVVSLPIILGFIQLCSQKWIAFEKRFVTSLQVLHILVALAPVVVCVTTQTETLILLKFFDLINVFDFFIPCDILIDILSLIMMFVVIVISFLVSIFAR